MDQSLLDRWAGSTAANLACISLCFAGGQEVQQQLQEGPWAWLAAAAGLQELSPQQHASGRAGHLTAGADA